MKKDGKTLRSGKAEAGEIRRELIPAWRDRPISEITSRDVSDLIEKVVDEGRPYVAFHLSASLSSKLFNWAIIRGSYGITASPVVRGMASTLIGKKEPRKRVLTEAEMREIWQATASPAYVLGRSCECSW